MRVLFHPWPHPDGTPRPDQPAEVVRWVGDEAILHVDVPGQRYAIVCGREGTGPGCWSREAPAVVVPPATPKPVDVPQLAKADPPAPKPSAATPPPPAAAPEPAATVEVQTCKMCFRRHRGDYMYCDRCAGECRPGGPPATRRKY